MIGMKSAISYLAPEIEAQDPPARIFWSSRSEITKPKCGEAGAGAALTRQDALRFFVTWVALTVRPPKVLGSLTTDGVIGVIMADLGRPMGAICMQPAARRALRSNNEKGSEHGDTSHC